MLMFVLACSVGVWSMWHIWVWRRYWCGGWCCSCGELRGDPEVSEAREMCSGCRLYPSQSHLQWEGGHAREKNTATEEERKKETKLGKQREEGSKCIYTWVMDLLRNGFFVLWGGWWLRHHPPQSLCWKVSFHWVFCPGRMANDVILRASAHNLTASMMGICIGASKVGRRNLLWNSLHSPSHTASMLLTGARHFCTHSICLPIFPPYIFLLFLKHTYFSFQTDARGDWLCPWSAREQHGIRFLATQSDGEFFARRTGHSGHGIWTWHHIIRM